MNRPYTRYIRHTGTFAVMVFTSFVLFACASTPSSPSGAAAARSKLNALQSDANLAPLVRVEIRDADAAVKLAEQPLPSTEGALGEHRVFMADRQVEIARAKAATRYAEVERARFAEEREAARLAARTLEADNARDDADYARADANRARDDANEARDDASRASADASRASADANRARDDAERARLAANAAKSDAAADAASQAAELQRQIDALEAQATDRGLVLTLGDVLFATGSSQLQGGASTRLNKLVTFLNQYPERTVLIEGHTDSIGNADYNQGLSQQRADSVRNYLTQQGIGSQRLSASGLGLTQPVADNSSSAGRQQNRRVEIIIENQPLASN